MKMANDVHKFVFAELFNNHSGKTSGSGFIGVMMGLVGCLAFIAAIVGFFMELPNVIDFMQQTIFFIGAATVLLGVRKFTGEGPMNKSNSNNSIVSKPTINDIEKG